jgi:hypothetical protein
VAAAEKIRSGLMTWRLIVALALCCTLSGCSMLDRRTVPVVTKAPTLEIIEKPQLESMTPEELTVYRVLPSTLREKLESNDRKLKTYAAKLEISVIEYNGWARLNNGKGNEWGGVKTEK